MNLEDVVSVCVGTIVVLALIGLGAFVAGGSLLLFIYFAVKIIKFAWMGT